MAYGVCYEKGRSVVGRTMPMRTSLHPMPGRMCLLSLYDVTLFDRDNVNAWLEAIRKSATMPAEKFSQTAASLSATLNTDLRCVSGAGNVYLCFVLVRVALYVTLLYAICFQI